jgi:hypothetical protein
MYRVFEERALYSPPPPPTVTISNDANRNHARKGLHVLSKCTGYSTVFKYNVSKELKYLATILQHVTINARNRKRLCNSSVTHGCNKTILHCSNFVWHARRSSASSFLHSSFLIPFEITKSKILASCSTYIIIRFCSL